MQSARQFGRGGLFRLGAVFLALVMAVCGFVQAVHMHDGLLTDGNPKSTASHCLICVAAHSAPLAATVSFVPIPLHSVAIGPLADPQLQSRLIIFSASIRPPPRVL